MQLLLQKAGPHTQPQQPQLQQRAPQPLPHPPQQQGPQPPPQQQQPRRQQEPGEAKNGAAAVANTPALGDSCVTDAAVHVAVAVGAAAGLADAGTGSGDCAGGGAAGFAGESQPNQAVLQQQRQWLLLYACGWFSMVAPLLGLSMHARAV